jgi:hypothetical protein
VALRRRRQAGDFLAAIPAALPPVRHSPALRVGGLIPNPLVSASDGVPVRLDAILAGRPAVLTARRPGAGLAGFCRRHGLVLARISAPGTGTPPGPGAQQDADWIDVRLADDAAPAGLRALVADPARSAVIGLGEGVPRRHRGSGS